MMRRYFVYLDELRESGVTNMFGAPSFLVSMFGVDKSFQLSDPLRGSRGTVPCQNPRQAIPTLTDRPDFQQDVRVEPSLIQRARASGLAFEKSRRCQRHRGELRSWPRPESLRLRRSVSVLASQDR